LEVPVPSIIVVDDSAVDRRLAGSLLEQHLQCSVRYAGDGKEALRLIAAGLPDLMLADMQMPEMDGLELVAAVKRDYPFVPVILMTAQGSEDIAARALRVGAASYVPKRHLARDLLPTVQRILAGSREDRGHSGLMHYLEAGEEAFVLPNDLALVKALVDYTQEKLRCLPLADETERLRVGLALEEALTNAYYHGNLEVGAGSGPANREAYEQRAAQRLEEAPYRDRRIRATLRVSRQEAVFVVRDEGPGFNVERLASVASLPDADRAAGRGIILMHATMDEVRYNAAGNEVTLVKRGVSQAPPTEEDDTVVQKGST
jgi:CheY-like chemotaxis protein/anti-sigma regulatory factor (Ser/Thr protein kinase)